MLIKARQLVFVFFLHLGLCIAASLVVNPFSVISFIGPGAASASALILIWGSRILLPVFFATIVFCFFLFFYHHYQIELSVVLISFLAITLQAFWTKQLAYRFVKDQEWLNSRILLLIFLTKIGPLASIVSASATVLVAVLDAKMLASSLSYAFFSSWAGSVLVVLFLSPTLLFSQGQQKLTLSKRVFVIFASFLGSISIGLLFSVSQKSHQHQRNDHFAQVKAIITEAIDDELETIQHQMVGIGSLFIASDHVSANEFSLFAKNIYNEKTSVRALEWAPSVILKNKLAFEKFASQELDISYHILEQSVMGDLVSAPERNLYLPVLYTYPYVSNMAALGVDLLRHPDKSHALKTSAQNNKLVSSAPLTLVQDVFSNPGILIFNPVYNASHRNHYGDMVGDDAIISGYIIAVVQFDGLFKRIANDIKSKEIKFFVSDTTSQTPYILFGESGNYHGRIKETLLFNVFTRQWQVTIYENEPWDIQPKTWQVWILLIGATLGGMFFQLLILMMAAYSTELSNKVIIKTRELILSKDLSDKANTAKSRFIETLGIEFKSSIDVINAFLEQTKSQTTNSPSNEYLDGINNATKTLEHLVNNLSDLNSIEAGQLTVENKMMDLHDFVHRMESMFKATAQLRKQSIKVVISNNVPQFIEADEHRIQQLLLAIINNAYSILKSDVIRLSVKAHLHKLANTSIFFVVTVGETEFSEPNSLLEIDENNHEFESHSTAMAMVKELCQLLGGDAKIVNLPSRDTLINVSIKVDLPILSKKSQSILIENSTNKQKNKNTDVILLSKDKVLINKLTVACLDMGRPVEVYEHHHDVLTEISRNQYNLLIIDADSNKYNALTIAQQLQKNEKNELLSIVGIFSEITSPEFLMQIKSTMNGYLEKPLNIEKFNYYLKSREATEK